MLVTDLRTVGNALLSFRKRAGMTQAEAAEAAGLSDRTYADIERGTVNMRLETLLRICQALHLTPDDLLTADNNTADILEEDILFRLHACSHEDKETALRLLDVYLRSLEK